MSSENEIANLLHENRRFTPSAEFAEQAIAGPKLYEKAKADRL